MVDLICGVFRWVQHGQGAAATQVQADDPVFGRPMCTRVLEAGDDQ